MDKDSFEDKKDEITSNIREKIDDLKDTVDFARKDIGESVDAAAEAAGEKHEEFVGSLHEAADEAADEATELPAAELEAGAPEPLQPVALQRDENLSVQFGNQFVHISVAPWPVPSGKGVFAVDYSKIDDNMVLRTRAPGDRISLQGRGCSKTLKKYYNEQKLPPELRDRTPVLADSRGVIFAQHAGVDASRAPDKNTKTVLLVKTVQIDEITDK